jgi:hypothetical protein
VLEVQAVLETEEEAKKPRRTIKRLMLVAALPCKRFLMVAISFWNPDRGCLVLELSFRGGGTEGARLVSWRRSSSS